MKLRASIPAVVGAALGALIASLSASAAFPGQNGKIVFQTNRDGNAEIYTMNADGTNRVNLSRNRREDVDPHWSADGGRIVFASNRNGNYDIFTMNADGSSVESLAATPGPDRWPSWTSDGRVVFHGGTFPQRHLYLVNADGTGLTDLTPGAADSAWAGAAPRPPMVAFSRYTDADGQRLYTLNLTSGVTKLAVPAPASGGDVQVNWSPNGNDLVFVRFTDAGSELFSVHKDGTDLVQLTDTADRVESAPAFSPDGTKIAFHACSGEIGTPSQHCANYVRNVDGTNESEITSIPTAPYLDTFTGDRVDPFWSVGSTGGGPIVGQANGQLEVTLPVGTSFGPNGYANAYAFMSCRFPGDFDMQVDYRLLSGPLPVGVNVGFDAAEFIGGAYSGEHGMFVHNPGFGSPGISTHFPDPGGVYQPPFNDFVPDASLSGSIRLVRSTTAGITTVTASRLSGTSWSFTSLPYTVPTSQAANLNVFTNLSPFDAEVRVAYDNFRINRGTISCPSWWDDSAPNWQPIVK